MLPAFCFVHRGPVLYVSILPREVVSAVSFMRMIFGRDAYPSITFDRFYNQPSLGGELNKISNHLFLPLMNAILSERILLITLLVMGTFLARSKLNDLGG